MVQGRDGLPPVLLKEKEICSNWSKWRLLDRFSTHYTNYRITPPGVIGVVGLSLNESCSGCGCTATSEKLMHLRPRRITLPSITLMHLEVSVKSEGVQLLEKPLPGWRLLGLSSNIREMLQSERSHDNRLVLECFELYHVWLDPLLKRCTFPACAKDKASWLQSQIAGPDFAE